MEDTLPAVALDWTPQMYITKPFVFNSPIVHMNVMLSLSIIAHMSQLLLAEPN